MSSTPNEPEIFDYVIVGSGFGGSVSAMRLGEKGYRVLVLERGRRYRDQDFPRSNWELWNYLWMPALGMHGFMQISMLPGVMILHGSGVGGGSLVYAGVLMEPDESFYEAPAWSKMADWKAVLRPHYATARRMLGVATNPQLWPADEALRQLAAELDQSHTFKPTEVGIFFGEAGVQQADPYFGGSGPARTGCTHCGGCMVGCRYNAKNSLPKNYLHFAEAHGVEVRSETQVEAISTLGSASSDGARFLVEFRPSLGLIPRRRSSVQAKNVVLSAGVLGTLTLLFRCRDELRTLPQLSARLGEGARTNSESFAGAWSRRSEEDHSQGLAITSIIQADPSTQVEVVRFSDGSSFMFWILGTPFVRPARSLLSRLWYLALGVLRQPITFLRSKLSPGIARRTASLMIMQTEENRMRLKYGRRFPTLHRRSLMAEHDREARIPIYTDVGHTAVRSFAKSVDGMASISITESLLGVPMTAHIMGGCGFGRDAAEGVVGLDCQVHNYPGLYVVDGSIIPANPGINPSLTITALAEYAMSQVPPKPGGAA